MTDKELTPEELQAELDKVRDALKRANDESAGRRKELEKIAAEKAEKDKAALSETEKLQAEVKAGKDAHRVLTAQLDAERVRTAILAEATKLGFASPEDAKALTDLSSIEISDDGKVTGFEKSLKALAESGRLAMADQKRGDSLGTPLGKGKPVDKADKEPVTIRV